MLSFLKNHPFAVEAFFDRSLVLTFAAPKEALQGLIPPCLALDTFEDRWAFIALAMVQTSGLRPKGFNRVFGSDFFLTGYRVFTRFTTEQAKRLRGLYILRSETDKKRMAFFGNLFTHYRYTITDTWQEGCIVQSQHSGLLVETEEGETLPVGSPFHDWKDARKFAGPLPFTFTYLPKQDKVLIVEGVRENWTPRPVVVKKYCVPFIDSLRIDGLRLAGAFAVENIPYHWEKGRLEKWRP
jgi:Uncharacterized conserved protein (COG2071)